MSSNETVAIPARKPAKKGSMFSLRKRDYDDDLTLDEINQKNEQDVPEVGVPQPASLQPVSFSELFRFTTRREMILNCIGILGAMCAGAANPLMGLIYGKLTQQFVNFGVLTAQARDGNATAAALIPPAAEYFRTVSSHDASYLVYMGVGMFCATFTYMHIWVYTGEVSAKRLREAYLRAILRQDIAFFDNVGAGEVATRIQTDTNLFQRGVSEKMALSVVYLSSFGTGFTLAYVRSWRLALALTSIIPCLTVTGALMNKVLSRCTHLSRGYIADGGNIAEEIIATIRTAQAFGTQKTLANIYDSHLTKARKADDKHAVYNGAGMAIIFFVVYSAYGLAFSFGTTLINEGHASAGVVVNVFLSILVGSFALAQLAPEIQAITQARGAAAKLYETIGRVPTIDSSNPGGLKPEKVEGLITFENVKFSYPSRPDVPIVKDLTIAFPAGKTAALVGASGSGKSTVVNLVERFYDPLSGVVKLDGVDLRDLNVKWLRTQVGLVSQEPTLFATTIRGNVAHGLIGTIYEHAPEEEQLALIKEACIKANAHDFICSQTDGYDTMVGERGFLMSGGQKQRIAIARAIVSDPRILLLDEATSALDTQSEGIVQDALDKAAAGRTTITIAHRLSTVKDADCIYVMGDGLVLEKGTHTELLRDKDGPYSRLVTAQKLREEKENTEELNDATSEGEIEDKIKAELTAKRASKRASHRMSTVYSVASEMLAEKKRELWGESQQESDISLFQLCVQLAKINRDGRSSYVIGFLAACLTGMVYPSFGVVYAKGITAFEETNPEKRTHDANRIALWFFLIAIACTFTIGLQNFMFEHAAASLIYRLRSLSFRAILRQDIEYFDEEENSTGHLTASLSENTQKIRGLAGITLGALTQSCSTVVAGIVLGMVFLWKLGLIAMACMPVLISAGYIRLRVVVLKDEINKKAHAKSAQIACEAAGAIRTVASLTREDDCSNLYSRSLEAPLKQSTKSALWSNLLFALSQSASFYVIALVFWFGARLVSQQKGTTLEFFIALMSSTFGAIQAGNMFTFVPDMSSAHGAGTDIIRLLKSVPEIDAESSEGKPVSATAVKGRLVLKNLHFRYPTRPGVRVLRNLSITVEPGTYIALVGASGSGKSTVIQMIERFYDPLAGEIYLDNELIADLNVQEYRKQIALVSQEPTLYSGTVRFNILLGAIKPASEVTQEELEQACRSANILDFIQSLPDGFDTAVGGKGSQLSGGQKQRIAIARALLRNPKVLLLDEATSALDSNSERVVQDALDKAAKGRTTIAIAHRLSTIQNADCIYFIKEGAVCESGTHDDLIMKRGAYYEYVQMQGLSKND